MSKKKEKLVREQGTGVALPADAPSWVRRLVFERSWRPPTPEQLKKAAAERKEERKDLTAIAEEQPIAAVDGKPSLDKKNALGIPKSYVGVFGSRLEPDEGMLADTLDIAYGMLAVYLEHAVAPHDYPEAILAGGVFGEGEVGFAYFDEPKSGGDVKVFALAAAWLARRHGKADLFESAVQVARKRYLKLTPKRVKQKKGKR